LNDVADGEFFAEFLWGAYGPYNKSWTGPRPLDGGKYGAETIDSTTKELKHLAVDGFDFNIELPSTAGKSF
jgi:chitinase